MATRPVTTGAPTRANVIPFPLSQAANLRQRLSRYHSRRMHDRWTADLKQASDLSEAEYRDLALRATLVLLGILLAEAC